MKSKQLKRSVRVILENLQSKHSYWERNNLQFQAQDQETRQYFYSAIDSLKKFHDNIS